MGEQDAGSHLADVGALATHVRTCNDLKVRTVWHHLARVADAACRILNFNQRMAALYQVHLHASVHFWPHILVIMGDLGEGGEHIKLRYEGRNLFEQRIVGRSDLENLLNKFVLLYVVLFLQVDEFANQIFEARASESHNSVLNREDLVGIAGFAHARIAFFLVDLKDESVLLGLY